MAKREPGAQVKGARATAVTHTLSPPRLMIPPSALTGSVLGLGIDLVDIARIRSAGERHGDRFIDKVFTPAERASLAGRADPWPGYAARFAAKEAISKAFGTGIGEAFDLHSAAILTDALGAPYVELDDKGARLLAERGGSRVLISLTHTETLAQACAVIVA